MSEIRPNIDTFSVGFSLPDKSDEQKFNRDFELARRTAERYGTRHHEVLFCEEDALAYLSKAVYAQDEPIANPTALPQMLLAEFTKKQGVDVVLGGDGGDELFGGYERYRLSLWASLFQKLPAFLRNILSVSDRLRKLNTPAGIERFALFMFQKDKVLSRVLRMDAFDTEAATRFFGEKCFAKHLFPTFEEQFLETDRQTWLPDESLMRTDKMAMSAGVEARAPLLDNELLEFAATIPLSYTVTLFGTKRILKKAFRGFIPEFLFSQPKRGWFSPGAKWLRNPAFFAAAKEILSSGYYHPTASLFNFPEIQAMLGEHRSGTQYNFTMLWTILVFQVWAKAYNVAL